MVFVFFFFPQEMLQSSPAALPPASNPPPGIVVPAAALPPGNLAMSAGSGSPAVPGRDPGGGWWWGGGGGRNLGVSVAPRAFFCRRWSLVPARDNGDVTGPGPRPSHCPRCPADPQRPGKNFPPQISISCNVLNCCSKENPQFLKKFNPWSILNF